MFPEVLPGAQGFGTPCARGGQRRLRVLKDGDKNVFFSFSSGGCRTDR